MKRKITATFPNGDVMTRTTTNPNLGFAWRVTSADAGERETMSRYAGLKGFRSNRGSCEEELNRFRKSATFRDKYPGWYGEVVPITVEGEG